MRHGGWLCLGYGVLEVRLPVHARFRNVSIVVTLLLTACTSAQNPAPLGSASPQPTASPSPSPALIPATSVTLSGQGDKSGPGVNLEGNYTISARVAANAGCSWTLSIKPGNNDVVDISTDAPGSQETSLPIFLDSGSYQMVVTSTNCGDWTVSLTR